MTSSILTQEEILSLARPSKPIVNPFNRDLAIWPSSQYDFNTSKFIKQFNLINLTRSEGIEEEEEVGQVIKKGEELDNLEIDWLDRETIVYIKSITTKEEEEEIQESQVWALNVETREDYLLGTFPVQISNLKTFSPEEEVAFLSFSCSIFPSSNSTIYTYRKELRDFKQENSLLNGGSDGLVYDETFVRHWDEWKKTTGEKLQVQIVRLSKNPSYFDDDDDDSNQSDQEEEEEEEGFEKIDEREGKWGFELESSASTRQQEGEGAILKKSKRPKVISPMQGSKLECPVGPFGSTADFSISKSHLLIHSKDPNVSPSWHTRTNVYILPFYPRSKRDESEKVEMLSIGNQGASSNPIFINNHDHDKVAWFEMREDGYEADRNRLIVYDLKTKQRRGLTEDWDSSPSANLESSLNGESLFMTAEERGHVVLYEVGLLDGKRRKLTERDSISSVCALRDDRVLLSIHSFTSPNQLYLLSTATTAESTTTTTVTPPPRLLASLTRKFLSTKILSQAEEFLFLGSKGQEVHGWILFPPTTTTTGQSSSKNDSKLLPLANLCHGGPQSAWNSSWSTRWNPQSYTLKGYVTVMINRTGSTGFGQKFCDEIKQDWGGAPFRDLVAGIEYVKKTWKNKIDPERMANLGASYGGFMSNYIQGHNDAFGFKCIVTHDGVFNLAQTYYSTDELYFPTREFGGTPWENPQGYSKFSPNNFIKNWKTPHLVIHGSKDYRLVESEGLGVFNTLQRLGIPSRLLIFPSENHWVLNPRNSLKWHQEVFRFIGEFTNTKD